MLLDGITLNKNAIEATQNINSLNSVLKIQEDTNLDGEFKRKVA